MTSTTPPTPHHSPSGSGTKPLSPEMVSTVATAIQSTRLALKGAGIDEAPLEAEVLVRHVAGIDRTALYAHPDRTFTDREAQQLDTLVARRCQREPLPYILGHWEFYGLDFLVNSAVLIPRPETETLIEEALSWAQSGEAKEPGAGSTKEAERHLRIADVGTGSGCIAVSLAVNLPLATIVATDTSAEALGVAKQNAERHNVQSRIQFVEGDLLTDVEGAFDLIVSNPPYIPDEEVPSLQPEVAHYEPSSALRGGPDGLSIIRRLLEQASSRLSPKGAIIIEFNAPQSTVLLSEARSLWPDAVCRIVQDLAGLDRVLVIEREERAKE